MPSIQTPKITTNVRAYPDHMYVPAPAVAKVGSMFVIALCLFSLVLSISTGFSLIDPFACVIAIVGGCTFYSMGAVTEKRAAHDRTRV